MFFAEHNVAFQVVEHLLPLLKETITDSEIVQKSKLRRNKCTSIIKNVLAEQEKSDLISKRKINKVSIMVDESTDRGSIKACVVLLDL